MSDRSILQADEEASERRKERTFERDDRYAKRSGLCLRCRSVSLMMNRYLFSFKAYRLIEKNLSGLYESVITIDVIKCDKHIR